MIDDSERRRPDLKRADRSISQCPACGGRVATAGYCVVCRAGTRAERDAGIHPGYEVAEGDT